MSNFVADVDRRGGIGADDQRGVPAVEDGVRISTSSLERALFRCAGVFVFSASSSSGAVLSTNADVATWFPTVAWGSGESDGSGEPASVFLAEQPGVLGLIKAGEAGVFRGIWRGLRVEAHVVPTDLETGEGASSRGAIVTVYPSVVTGAKTVGAVQGLAGRNELDDLTPNEREVLELIGLGLKTRDIARILHRSEKTIEARRSSIGRKLGLETRGELVRTAVRAGLSEL